MKELKVNKDNLRRFHLTTREVNNGHFNNAWKKSLRENVMHVMDSPMLTKLEKATTLSILVLSRNNTKPVVMNKENRTKMQVIVTSFMNMPSPTVIKKEMGL